MPSTAAQLAFRHAPDPASGEATTDQLLGILRALSLQHHFGTPLTLRQGMPRLASYHSAYPSLH